MNNHYLEDEGVPFIMAAVVDQQELKKQKAAHMQVWLRAMEEVWRQKGGWLYPKLQR